MRYHSEKLLHHQTNFHQWNEKITKDFNVHMCIDCWVHDFHKQSLNDTQPHIMKNLGNLLVFFFQADIFIFHWNIIRQKFQYHHLGQCTFLTHHWISLSSNYPHTMILFTLLFSCLCVSLVWFVGFYGISTFVGYLRPNPFLCK